VALQCPSCKSEAGESARFCDECGAPLSVSCPSCAASNRPGAKFCAKCGNNLTAATPPPAQAAPAASRPATQAPWAERRQITVMFCDLVGSTALSARLDPEDLRDVISTYHNSIAEVVARFSGFVARYMGDGVLVYFGYPQAHEDDAERAVRVGLELMTAVPALRPRTDTILQCRVGIATGSVIVGDLVGTGEAQEHGIIGETPNLAARLQTLAKPNEVVLDQKTRLLVGNLFECQDVGAVKVAGIAEPVHIWRAVRSQAVEGRFEAFHAAAQTPLIGREEEMELLQRRWARVKSGNGQVVLLSGEPGIGKSRITRTLQERLQGERHATLRWFCSPYRQDSALHPVISYLERTAEFDREDRPQEKLAKLKDTLAIPTPSVQDVVLLAELLSIPLDDRYPPLGLTAHQIKEKTFEALLRQIELRARQQPLLMVYEDAQWSDPTSLELLDLIVPKIANIPVLLIVTFRPEFQPPWTGAAHVASMTLSRLDRSESNALVQEIVTTSILADDVVAEILKRTEGVPLFIEELTKAMIEGAAVQSDETASSVPSSLQASLLARLDRLPAAKHVAQVGSVIGREFGHELLASVATFIETTLLQGLDELILAGLAFRRGTPPDATYVFKHVLVQETAYSTLLRRRRQELHARITAVLEEGYPDIVEQQPELLAHHCTHAGLIEKAIAYLSRAGKQSLARSAAIEAAAQLRKGLELLPKLPDGPDRWKCELELQSTLGAALVASQGNSAIETGQAYMRARELCERLGDTNTLVPVLSGLSTYHQTRSEYGAMRLVADDLLRLGRQQNHVASVLVGNRSMGLCQYHLGSFTSAQAHCQEVINLYVPSTHGALTSLAAFDMRSVALTYRSLASFILGDIKLAQASSEQAMAWSRNLRHPHNLAFALAYASLLKMLHRPDSGTLELLDELTVLTTEHHFPAYLAISNVLRGRLSCAQGRPADGLLLIRRGLLEIERTGASWNQSYFLGLLALSCEDAGFADEAFDALTRALQHADRTDERWFEAELHRQRGEWLAAHRPDQTDDAEASFQHAIALAQEQHAKSWELRAAASLARHWRKQGRQQEAHDLLAPVCAWFGDERNMPDLERARTLLREVAA
jgi:predicted ATPase/class 3 adenylate cyclase